MVASTNLLIDVSSCHEMNLLESESKSKVQQVDADDETQTTDVGSAMSSDAESTTSASSDATTSCHRVGRPSRVRFCSTLESIPGTPVAGNHAGSGICTPLQTSPSKKQSPLREEVSDCHEFSADESDVESKRSSMEIFHKNLGDHAPPLPPPRSPKRRTKCSLSSSMKLAVNAASMNSFSTLPIMCSSKRRSQPDFPNITSIMCGQLGTTPVKTRRRSHKSCIQHQTNALAVTSDCEGRLEKGIYGTSPAFRPQALKDDAHDALLRDARSERVPLKVDLAWSLEAGVRKTLDPTMSAKKRPVFADIAGAQAEEALSHFEGELPLKKRVSSFLLEEPPRTRRAPSGLVRMAR